MKKKVAEYKEKPTVSYVKESVAAYYAMGKSVEKPVAMDYKESILRKAGETGRIRRKDVEHLLGLKQTRAFHLLQELCEEGKLRSVGMGRSSYYEVVRKTEGV